MPWPANAASPCITIVPDFIDHRLRAIELRSLGRHGRVNLARAPRPMATGIHGFPGGSDSKTRWMLIFFCRRRSCRTPVGADVVLHVARAQARCADRHLRIPPPLHAASCTRCASSRSGGPRWLMAIKRIDAAKITRLRSQNGIEQRNQGSVALEREALAAKINGSAKTCSNTNPRGSGAPRIFPLVDPRTPGPSIRSAIQRRRFRFRQVLEPPRRWCHNNSAEPPRRIRRRGPADQGISTAQRIPGGRAWIHKNPHRRNSAKMRSRSAWAFPFGDADFREGFRGFCQGRVLYGWPWFGSTDLLFCHKRPRVCRNLGKG